MSVRAKQLRQQRAALVRVADRQHAVMLENMRWLGVGSQAEYLRKVHALVANGVMRGSSVGFVAMEVSEIPRPGGKRWTRRTARAEIRRAYRCR